MKKKIIFLLVLFFTFIFKANLKADIIQSPKENKTSTYLCENKSFNLIRGITNDKDLNSSYFSWHLMDNLNGYLVEGKISLVGKLYATGVCLDLEVAFIAEDGGFTNYNAYLNNELIYAVSISDYELSIDYYKEVNLYEKYKTSFYFSYEDVEIYYDDDIVIQNNYTAYINEFDCIESFQALYIMEYKVNTGYDENELIHIISDSNNPLTIEEILDSIEIEDETEGIIEEYEVLENEYIVENNYIEPGDYSLVLLTRDSYGNTTVFKSYVSVYDVTPPIIEAFPYSISYVAKMTNEQILGRFKTEMDAKLEIIEDNYSANFNVLGDYTITIKATDPYGNSSTKDVTITVVDDVPPVLTISKNVCISTLDNYSLEDFKKYVQSFDQARNDYMEVTLVDTDGYLNNTKQHGTYSFDITSYDLDDNPVYGKLSVNVIDCDYPLIKPTEYTLIVMKGYEITKEDVISILKKRGQISDGQIEVESLYFDEAEPNGNYLLEVTDSNGNHFSNSIETYEIKHDIDYSPVIKENEDKTDYTVYYVTGGVIIVFVILLGILFIVKKKRH